MPTDAWDLPPAGLSTGQITRVKTHVISHFEPLAPLTWKSNPTAKPLSYAVYPAPDLVPRSLETNDLQGARPRSRPGLGMGRTGHPDGSFTLNGILRNTLPLRPNYQVPVHLENTWVPEAWRTGKMETGEKKSGLVLDDIYGTSPGKCKPARRDYDIFDYSDVTGNRRYRSVFKERESSSLTTKDIMGAAPISLLRTRCRPGVAYKEIERTAPTQAPFYSLGRWPPPSVVHHTIPRTGRGKGALPPAFTTAKVKKPHPRHNVKSEGY